MKNYKTKGKTKKKSLELIFIYPFHTKFLLPSYYKFELLEHDFVL